MKKYVNGEYVELSSEEIESVEKEESEYLLEDEDEKNTSNAVKETVTGKEAIVIVGVSPIEQAVSVKGTANTLLRVYGQNIWDEELDFTSGFGVSKNYIPVISGVQYYLYCNSNYADVTEPNMNLFSSITYYDVDFNELSDLPDGAPTSATRNSVITIPSGCCYIKFVLFGGYGVEYNKDICINVFDERINGTYAQYQGISDYTFAQNEIEQVALFYPVTTMCCKGSNLECEYNKDINVALAGKQDKIAMELLYDGTTTEEVSTISVTTDKEGNAFELEELYAVVKIPSPNNINSYLYFANGTTCYTPFGALGTNNSTLLISWKRENLCAKIEQYQYYDVFKTAKILEITDNIAVNQFRMQVFSDTVFPIGTEIKVWGRKVQE